MKLELEDKDVRELYENLEDLVSALEPLKYPNGQLGDDLDVISTWLENYSYEKQGPRICRAISAINRLRKLFHYI